MLGISVFGSGRMGEIHVRNIGGHPNARLVSVVNPNLQSAQRLTSAFGGSPVANPRDALGDPEVNAVVIATPTSTHLELIELAARSGKAILCEKPLDLSIERVDAAIRVIKSSHVPFMLGFNRRFDPGVTALQQAVRGGQVGDPHIVLLTSRDPGPPPIGYIKRSGGYFADSTIHDIDLACWITGERPVEIFATGSNLIDPKIESLGDVDTAMTVLRMPSGCLAHVNNSRRSVYGFDQRIEVFGSAGMIKTVNQREDNLVRSTSTHTSAQAPLKHFFLERYAESFEKMLDEFIEAATSGREPKATYAHGRDALTIALACVSSRREGRIVYPTY